MARPWLSLLLLSLVLGVIDAFREYACPEKNVCVVFVNNSCRLNGSYGYWHKGGFMWVPGLECDHIIGNLQAILEIAPQSLRKWNFTVWTPHSIENIKFEFGTLTSTLTFLSNTTVEFKYWNILEYYNVRSSIHPIHLVDCYKFGNNSFCKYSFTIASSEKLIKLIGSKWIDYVSGEKERLMLSDQRVVQQLDQLTACDRSEIQEVCYDHCYTMFDFLDNRTNRCLDSSKLWYHSPSMFRMIRTWHQSDHNSFTCKMGEWTLGSQVIDSSLEWQCYDVEPVRVTVFAIFFSGAAFCVVALMAGCCMLILCNIDEGGTKCEQKQDENEADESESPNTINVNEVEETNSANTTDIIKVEETKIPKEKPKWNKRYNRPTDPTRRHEIDSVVICDGNPAFLSGTIFAAHGDGRLIFVLGKQRISSIGYEYYSPWNGDVDDMAVTFDIHVIDMFLARKRMIIGIGDLYSFGDRRGFYALNDQTVVIIDYHANDGVIRQRLVQINTKRATAECVFYRTYAVRFRDQPYMMVYGEQIAIVMSRRGEGCIIPKNPLFAAPQREIAPLITQVRAFFRQFWVQARLGEWSPAVHQPFVITDSTLGFFLKHGTDGYFNLMTIVVLDLNDGSIHLREATSSAAFTTSIKTNSFSRAHWTRTANEEVTFAVCFYNAELGSQFGMLNTRTMHWDEIKCGSVEESRVIGEAERRPSMARYRLIRHPTRVPSLVRLASIALQKSGRLETEELEMIAERID